MIALSPKQERSIAHAQARINLWTGSIRSGKTIASLLRFLLYAATAPRGGALVIAGRTLDTVARNVMGPLQDPAITGPAAQLVRYTRGATTGSILGRPFEVITSNDARGEAKLRGLTCAGAYVDELTLLQETFFDQLLGRMSVPGAMLFGTSNPDNPGHWLRKRFILRAGELGIRHWHFVLDDNPGLDPAYVAAIKLEYVGLWYRRFILGDWCLAEGAVYDMFDEARHVVTVLPHIQRWIGLGVDYGTRNAFAGLLLGLGADSNLYLGAEYRYDSKTARKQLSDAQYSAALRSWLAEVPVPLSNPPRVGVSPEYVAVDPSAASFRVQLLEDGVSSVAANNEVLDGIRTMSSLLAANRLFIHSSCAGLLEELPGYSWDEKAAQVGKDEPIKAEDHSLDAARYAIQTTRPIWTPYVRSVLTLAA